jgi:heterodisulfide reductase subunit A
MQKIRIGVFVCHCGSNIASAVDVVDVVEYSKGLPYVIHAETNLYTCSPEGLRSIKNRIEQYNLNRVVVASCTPRTHEALFRDTCEEAGVNRYLFEFVNIREHCSWVHLHRKEAATAKANELVRMGVAKVSLLESQDCMMVPIHPSTLIIGGGISGMTAALNLANQGFEVHLVEQEGELGGLLKGLNRLLPTNEDAQEFLHSVVKKVKNHRRIKIHLPAKVSQVSGYVGNFEVGIEEGVSTGQYQMGTIIVATGAQVFQPQRGDFGYAKMANVITQLELEERFRKGTETGQNVVMINCVGARIPERFYCSTFCCSTAIKNGILIKENNPSAKVHILYRELMAYGVEYEKCYQRAMQLGVRFIRYNLEKPPQIVGNGRATRVKVYDELFGQEVELPSDLVVLTTPLVSYAENTITSRILKVPLTEDGFFLEAHVKLRPTEFATEGIYVCGAARWPSSVGDCVAQAYAASAKAAILMRKGFAAVEPITSFVNEAICAGCGNCSLVCPFDAVEVQLQKGRRIAVVTSAKCKGCGSCAAVCPSGAMQQRGFTDQQMIAMLDAIAEGD